MSDLNLDVVFINGVALLSDADTSRLAKHNMALCREYDRKLAAGEIEPYVRDSERHIRRNRTDRSR